MIDQPIAQQGLSPTRLILASASPARARLLHDAGIDAETTVSGIDEEAITAHGVTALVAALAEAKARAVAARIGGAAALVLGCDSLLDLDGTAYGKPADAAEVRARWSLIGGREGVLRTGHCLVDTRTGRVHTEVAATTVRFGTPTPAEVDAYVATGEPLGVAGAFTLDGYGGWFVESIDGDHGTVLGLSLPLLRRMFAAVGVTPAQLWNAPPPAAGPAVEAPAQP